MITNLPVLWSFQLYCQLPHPHPHPIHHHHHPHYPHHPQSTTTTPITGWQPSLAKAIPLSVAGMCFFHHNQRQITVHHLSSTDHILINGPSGTSDGETRQDFPLERDTTSTNEIAERHWYCTEVPFWYLNSCNNSLYWRTMPHQKYLRYVTCVALVMNQWRK